MSSDEVLWDRAGRLRIMTLNRPETKNALTLEGQGLQSALLREFADDDDAWILVITGAGGNFSTGLDLRQAGAAVGRANRPPGLTGHNPLVTWKPILAAIDGYALGGGCELALACDIRVASQGARLGFPEVKRALFPGAGGCQRLSRVVPLGAAFMLLFTGEWIDAAEAYRIGLVDRVVGSESALADAVTLAERIAANGPLAVRTVKESVLRGLDMSLPAALVQDNLLALRNRQTEDAAEGPRAFLEKRPPVYRGR